jgi:hypothetical protein
MYDRANEFIRERRRVGEEIDAQVARETPCPVCGRTGGTYIPRYDSGRNSREKIYTAIARCPVGHETAF